MKKTIITMAILFASLLGLNATAQNPTTCVTGGEQTMQCPQHLKKHHSRKAKMRHHGGVAMVFNALNGIKLEDSQKARLYDVREKYSTPSKEQRSKKSRQNIKPLIDEIKTILNDSQFKQFENNLNDQNKKVHKHHRQMNPETCCPRQNCTNDSIICKRK